MHVHSGVFGDRPIRIGLSLLLGGRRRAGAGSRTREELSETRRMPKSHSRPEDAHLEHLGRVSSHLILLRLDPRVSIEASHINGAAYRQVLHPSLVGLKVTTRFLPISCYFGRTITDEPGRPARYFASIRPVRENGLAIDAHTTPGSAPAWTICNHLLVAYHRIPQYATHRMKTQLLARDLGSLSFSRCR